MTGGPAMTADPRRRRHRLTRLRLDEISLVDAPANPGATILIAKRDDLAPTRITKADAEARLDALARAAMKADGTGYAVAYRKALRANRALYDAIVGSAASGDDAGAAERSRALAALDEMAAARQQQGGETFAAAYREVCRTPVGKRLYSVATG